MPAKTPADSRRWNLAVLAAGPGWVIIGAAEQLGGAFLAFFGLFGTYAEAFSTFIAAGLALVLRPLIAWATKGKHYLARPNTVDGPDVAVEDVTATRLCAVCESAYELPDIADCPVPSGPICSPCRSLDATCGDVCRKTNPGGAVILPPPTVRGV